MSPRPSPPEPALSSPLTRPAGPPQDTSVASRVGSQLAGVAGLASVAEGTPSHEGEHVERRRTGSARRRCASEVGVVQLDVPRDRDSTFELQVVQQRARWLPGVVESVISLAPTGLTIGKGQAQLAKVHRAEVREPVSRIGAFAVAFPSMGGGHCHTRRSTGRCPPSMMGPLGPIGVQGARSRAFWTANSSSVSAPDSRSCPRRTSSSVVDGELAAPRT